MVQPVIAEIRALAPLPSEDKGSIDDTKIALIEELESKLFQIVTPISDEEALVLLECFGPDDCFGLAWQIVHAVETAPSWPMLDVLRSLDGCCIELMKERCRNSGYQI